MLVCLCLCAREQTTPTNSGDERSSDFAGVIEQFGAP
jgi:hypothetical protein